jgi:hypothetical protein
MLDRKTASSLSVVPRGRPGGDSPNPTPSPLPPLPPAAAAGVGRRAKPPRGAGGGGSAITRSFGREARGLLICGGAPWSVMFRRRRAVPDDEVATRQPLGGGVTRWLLAAPSRPESWPFGLHLGLGGPCLGVAVLPLVVGGVARTGDGLDGDMLTAARQRELHKPAGSAGPEGLVCFCFGVRSVTTFGGGGRALLRVRCSTNPRSRLSLPFLSISLCWSW